MRALVIGAALAVGAVTVTVTVAGARQDPAAIARAIVIGQAYVSGNVYVGGFVEDERRAWPPAIDGVPLEEGRRERVAADFFRTVAQDSEEQYYFAQREGDPGDKDLFITIDKAAIEDRNLARYRAPVAVDQSVSFLGWDRRLALADISYRDETPRPLTPEEQKQVQADKLSVPKNVECSTEPRYLDSARIILTANIPKSSASIRLSSYLNPGCAGHLSEIYVLDVMSPGQPSRRFEFRHYHGVL